MPINISDMIVNISQQSSQIDWNTLWTTLMNGLVTLSAAFFGSFVTFKIYQQDKLDKTNKENKLIEEEKVKNLNILLIQLLECVYNTLLSLEVVEEQKNIYENNYAKAVKRAFRNNCDIETINTAIKHFIIELPGVMHNLNSLNLFLEWSKTYRERRNEIIYKKLSKESYNIASKREFDILEDIIYIIVPSLLVIYDFAISNFGENYTILKISKKEFLKEVWKYLPKDFKSIDVEANLQYKFQSEAILKWFFEILKKGQKTTKRKPKKEKV